MKKIKGFIFIILFLLLFTVGISVSADTGPKPSSYINIIGIEGDYVACFAAKEVKGPHKDFEGWLDGESNIRYNSIMEYNDEDGYKWISSYYMCKDNSQIKFTYYCPNEFKIVIYQNDELYAATEVIERYAFSSYYDIDFSNGDIKIKESYDHGKELLKLVVRVLTTLAIEVGLFFLMRLYSKRNLIIVILTNLATQIILNIIVNIKIFYNGKHSAIGILIIGELIVLAIEFIIYQLFIKDKKRWVVISYPIIANVLSLILGCILLINI